MGSEGLRSRGRHGDRGWGYECEEQPGGLHANEGFFLVEIEDVETGEPITEPGRRGKMIITALDRIAQPCIRFDSKDIIEWADYGCGCGRTFRIAKGGVVGRSDDITKVKGVLLAPSAIEEVVRSFTELGRRVRGAGYEEGRHRRYRPQDRDQARLRSPKRKPSSAGSKTSCG